MSFTVGGYLCNTPREAIERGIEMFCNEFASDFDIPLCADRLLDIDPRAADIDDFEPEVFIGVLESCDVSGR